MNKQKKATTQKIKFKLIFVDTNFFLIPWKFKVDIFSEFKRIFATNYEIIVIEDIIKELGLIENSKKSKGREKQSAKFALELIKKFEKNNKLMILNTEQTKKELIRNILKKEKREKINVDLILVFELLKRYYNNTFNDNVDKNTNKKINKNTYKDVIKKKQEKIIKLIYPILVKQSIKTKKEIKIKKDLKREIIANLKRIQKYTNNETLFIATQDKDLRDILSSLGIKLIELKQKKYLKIRKY